MRFELISFKLCPFVQRAVIVFKHKNVEHTITHIDLANPPAWFKEISPLGKVPVLKVDDEVLFESAVINEFIDEVTEGSLLAQDPLARAGQRAWIELTSSLNENIYHLTGAKTEEHYTKQAEQINARLSLVAQVVQGSKWFYADSLSLTDAAFAPFFMRAKILSEFSADLVADHAKLSNWTENLLGLDEVKNSVVPEFKELFVTMCKKRSEYLAELMAAH